MSPISIWPRRYRRWATPIVVIALLAGSFTPGLAKAVAADSSGNFTISGTVIGSDGATPSNIQVDAYGDNGNSFSAQTDASGNYSLVVAPDNYIVKFSGNGSDYVDGCLAIGASGNFTIDQYACPEVTVTTSDVPLPTVTMPLGVRINGTVTGSDEATPANILVDADTGNPGPLTQTVTGGTFSLLVPPGSYKLYFHDLNGELSPLKARYVDGCYASGASGKVTTDPNACTTLTFTMGSTVPPLNVTIPLGVQIRGRVIDQNGQGLPNMWVHLSPDNFGWLSMTTAADGSYSFAVIPGSYTVTFWGGGSDDHAGGCYYSVAHGNLDGSGNTCSPVTVTSPPVTLPDVTMPLGVRISGTVTGSDGKRLDNIAVAISSGTGTAADGTYSSNPLAPGSYTVRFYDDNNGASTYVNGCYDLGAPGYFTADWNDCTPVTVGTSNVPGINVTMPLAGGGTPFGSDVPVVPDSSTSKPQPVSLTFTNVGKFGTTTLTTSTTAPAPLPTGYQLAGSATYYDLETTATYSGSITVCISYAGMTTAPTSLLHYGSSGWTDITNYPVDTTNQTICGTTSSLSPFVLVTKSPMLTITASSATMAYGGTVPAFTPIYSGFVNGDTASGLTTQPTCTTTATSASGVGTYAITCSGAVDPNYSFTYVAGTLTINKAALTVTAPRTSRAYGASNPILSPTYSGFVAGNTAASLTTAATCTMTATSASGVGTYPVTCSGAVDPNYSFTYVAGTLSVVIVDRYWTPVGVTLQVAAPGFLALTNVGTSSVVVSSAPKGKLTLGSTAGSFTYVPPSGWTGADSFSYELKTGTTLSSPVTVTIFVLGSGMNCTGCNLSGLLPGALSLTGANLSKANLTGTGLGGANLGGSNLSGANLAGANLAGATLTGVNLSNATMTGAILPSANLTGANLSGATLIGANLTGATLTGVNLSSANLSSASLSSASLTGANLSGANLTNALAGHANLTGANLAKAILTGADLTGATLTGVAWGGATCPDGTAANSHSNTCVGHLSH